MRYNPFRITPYLLKVQGKGSSGEEEEPCCLALAERIISGYEGTKTLQLLKCCTLKDRFRVVAVYFDIIFLCSTTDPLGQAHLHHHALPGLCVLGSGWQVNKGFTIRFYNGPFLSGFVLMKLITIVLFCRAVPLLGYLPQDLIGSSFLTFIHPDDRPLMLSMHRKSMFSKRQNA